MYFIPFNFSCITSLTFGTSHTIGTVFLFNCVGSTHSLQCPSGFITNTTGEHHSESTLEITPTSTNFRKSFLRNARWSSLQLYFRRILCGCAPGFSRIFIGGNFAGSVSSYFVLHAFTYFSLSMFAI